MSDGFRPFKWGSKPKLSDLGKASPLEQAAPKPSFAPPPVPVPAPLKRNFQGDRLYLIDAQISRAVADELHERGLTNARFADILLTTVRHVKNIQTKCQIKMPMLARLCQVFGWTFEMRDAQGRLIVTYPHETVRPPQPHL